MKAQDQNADLIAAFLAKGGAVQVIACGANSGFTAREMNQAVRGNISRLVPAKVRAEREAENRWHEMHDTATEARMNGHVVSGYDDKGNVYTQAGQY